MDNKEDFFGFKSFTTPVLLILGSIVIFYLLYDNYQSFKEEKYNERIEEARKLTENEPKELDNNEQNEQRQEINNSRDNQKEDLENSEKIENKPTTKEDSPASVRKITCRNCNGTGREILPCFRCNYNINCERQGSGGYTQASQTNGIWRCRPCSDCQGRGVFPQRCGPCSGTGRVNEFE